MVGAAAARPEPGDPLIAVVGPEAVVGALVGAGAAVVAAPAQGAVAPTLPEAETERADLPLVGLVVTPAEDVPPPMEPHPATGAPPATDVPAVVEAAPAM